MATRAMASAFCDPSALWPQTLPRGSVGTFYQQEVSTTYIVNCLDVWWTTEGSLPDGLYLNQRTLLSVHIEGEPVKRGSFFFTLIVNAWSSYGQDYVIHIDCDGDIRIAPRSLAPGSTGKPYATSLSASGGSPPYGFSIPNGALPPGLTLSPQEKLSGLPTQPGDYTFEIEARDANNCAARNSYTLSICDAPSVSPARLDDLFRGKPHGSTLTASGGTPPYRYQLASGSLPAGLTLSSWGTIQGIPQTVGISTATVSVTDATGCVTEHLLSLEVSPQRVLTAGRGPGEPNPPTVRVFEESITPSFNAYGVSKWESTYRRAIWTATAGTRSSPDPVPARCSAPTFGASHRLARPALG